MTGAIVPRGGGVPRAGELLPGAREGRAAGLGARAPSLASSLAPVTFLGGGRWAK